MSYHPTTTQDYVAIKNATDISRRFTIGTYDPAGEETDFKPFVLTEDVSPGLQVQASHALLQIYLTSGVEAGQIMTESLLRNPLLSPSEGIKTAQLKLGKSVCKVLYGGLGGISLHILW